MTDITKIMVRSTGTAGGEGISTDTLQPDWHYLVTPGGMILKGLDNSAPGCSGEGAIDVLYVGGADKNGKAKDTRTPEQKRALTFIAKNLRVNYPEAAFESDKNAGFNAAAEADAWLAPENPEPETEQPQPAAPTVAAEPPQESVPDVSDNQTNP